jgi:hypothetical protein
VACPLESFLNVRPVAAGDDLEDAEDCFTIKSNSFGKSVAHSFSALMIRWAAFKLRSRSTSVKISVKATYAFASLKMVLPGWLYLLRTCETSDGCWLTIKYNSSRSTAVALLMRESVDWQKK